MGLVLYCGKFTKIGNFASVRNKSVQRMNPYENIPLTETHKLLKILLVSVSSPRAIPENLPISFPGAGNFRDNSKIHPLFF